MKIPNRLTERKSVSGFRVGRGKTDLLIYSSKFLVPHFSWVVCPFFFFFTMCLFGDSAIPALEIISVAHKGHLVK